MIKVIVVCFANTCRSPVAESLLRRDLAHVDDVQVSSRGVAGGQGTTPDALAEILVTRHLVLGEPRGVVLVRDEARAADLLLFAERRLLRESVVTDPSLWPKSFTLREFARRSMINPPDATDAHFAAWLAVLHAGRSRDELLGDNELDDVSDPGLAGTSEEFAQMIDDLESVVGKIMPVLIGWSTTSK